MSVAVEPIPLTTRIVTLASRPRGRPVPADFALEDQPLGELGPGQLLVRNVYMSVDPRCQRDGFGRHGHLLQPSLRTIYRACPARKQ